jgi:archaellum biogenesis ATPase FlaH
MAQPLSPRKVKKASNIKKIQIDLSVQILDMMIRFCFSSNSMVNFKKLRDLKKLVDMIDVDRYEEDRDIRARIHVLSTTLTCVVTYRQESFDAICSKITEGRFNEESREILAKFTEDDYEDLCNPEVTFIEEFISDRLQYAFIYNHQDELEQIMFKLRTGEFTSLKSFREEFISEFGTLHRKLSSISLMNEHAKTDFSTNAESLDGAFTTSITELKKPSNLIYTGIQMLNEMLNGGFQAGRVYLILGETGGWKSGFLLNCIKWAIEHNPAITCNDPSAKPCVLYVTQENDVNETNERIWSIIKKPGDPDELRDIDSTVVMERFGEAGWVSDDPTRMSAFIKYRPSRSITTADIEVMIEELALEGYEVKMVVHDYVKRIIPIEYTGDLRIDYGNTVDEFSTIAKKYGIPIITAAQLNRDATKAIELAMSTNKANIGQKLGLSHAGESKLMIDNADYVFANFIEHQGSTKKTFLTMKRLKSRGKRTTDTNYIAHPFMNGNGMRLDEDYGLTGSKSLTDLGDGLNGFNPALNPTRPARTRTHNLVDEADDAINESDDPVDDDV